jgi:death-on-curing protein
MAEPIWVLLESVKAIHKRQIAEHGGTTGVRDSELLESALAKPKNIYLYSKSQSSIPSLASAYAYAISKNHPFLDGNKRVALVVSIAFMKLNGWRVMASQEILYTTFWNLAAGKISEDELLLWFESVSKSDTF